MASQRNQMTLVSKDILTPQVKQGPYFSYSRQSRVLLRQTLVELNQGMIITCLVSLCF